MLQYLGKEKKKQMEVVNEACKIEHPALLLTKPKRIYHPITQLHKQILEDGRSTLCGTDLIHIEPLVQAQ